MLLIWTNFGVTQSKVADITIHKCIMIVRESVTKTNTDMQILLNILRPSCAEIKFAFTKLSVIGSADSPRA